MGTALYRQYRSTSFDEVIGQDHITSTLKNSLANGSIAHAYLLTGPRGVGKTSIARILAYAVNDLPYEKDGLHLDIIEIDAASNRRIDEIRSLRDKVHIAPTSSKYKVYIIDEVHMLTREAFNALLKTLEEPPAHVIFILATTEIHKLPDTIVSRCITFTFRSIDNENIVKHLKQIATQEKLKIEDDALELLAVHGDGSFRDSISLLDQIKNIQTGTITKSDIELSLGVAPTQTVNAILDAVSTGSAKTLNQALNDAYVHGASESKLASQIAEVVRTELTQSQSKLSSEQAVPLLKALLDVPGSPKPRAALELCLLDVLFTVKPVAGNITTVQPQVASTAAPIKKETPEPQVTVEVEIPTPQPTPAPEPQVEPEEIPAKPEPTPQEVTAIEPLGSDLWEEILNKLKKQNNTLYGIARMAEAEHTEQNLVVRFKFAFHYKQLSQPKNKAIVMGIMEALGQKHIVLDITLNDGKSAAGEPKKNDISNITDIFGSGEVLES